MNYFSAICMIFGLLMTISAAGGYEQGTLTLSHTILSAAIGITAMVVGLITSKP